MLRDGLTVVLIGRPNVGKSSLSTASPAASGHRHADRGHARDHVRATVSVEGVPVHLVDTAGLRTAGDEIERIGIERTWAAIESAGAALYITDGNAADEGEERAHLARLPGGLPRVRVVNKIDLTGEPAGTDREEGSNLIRISAKTGAGVPELRAWLGNGGLEAAREAAMAWARTLPHWRPHVGTTLAAK